jgi:hypothetical protein
VNGVSESSNGFRIKNSKSLQGWQPKPSTAKIVDYRQVQLQRLPKADDLSVGPNSTPDLKDFSQGSDPIVALGRNIAQAPQSA